MTEATIQREIVAFVRQLGFAVYVTSQGYRRDPGGTRTTAGVPDLYIIGHGFHLWVEVKTEKGKLRPSQEAFRLECLRNGVPWRLWRDVTDAWDWAVSVGVIREAA